MEVETLNIIYTVVRIYGPYCFLCKH